MHTTMKTPFVRLCRWLAVIACLLLGTLSCALFRPVREYPPFPHATELLAGLNARAAHWQAFQAQAAVRLQSAGGNYRLQAFLLASPPDRLRFEATNPAGQTIWALIINPESAMFWLPMEGVCYQARKGETILRHFAGAPIPPAVFAYGFVGVIPPEQLQDTGFRLAEKGSLVLGQYWDSKRQWRFTWELLPQSAALQSLKAVASQGFEGDESTVEHQYTIRFEPPVPIEPHNQPQKVVISTRRWQLEATLKQLLKLDVVPPQAFDPISLPGTRIVNLDSP